jgi:transcriptional regulator with XRE-family HTH domain
VNLLKYYNQIVLEYKAKVMDYRKIFCQMLDEMSISAAKLARQAKVEECQISHFRNGKAQLRVDTFFALLEAADVIRPGAKKYFAMQYSKDFNISNLVESLSHEQLGDLLIQAASRVKSMSPGKNQDQERAQSELSHA